MPGATRLPQRGRPVRRSSHQPPPAWKGRRDYLCFREWAVRRTQVGDGPAVDGGQCRLELLDQDRRGRPPVVDPDLFGPQSTRLVQAVVDPPDGADIEHVTGPLAIADGQNRLSAQLPRKAELPGRLSAPVTVDQQVVFSGKG